MKSTIRIQANATKVILCMLRTLHEGGESAESLIDAVEMVYDRSHAKALAAEKTLISMEENGKAPIKVPERITLCTN